MVTEAWHRESTSSVGETVPSGGCVVSQAVTNSERNRNKQMQPEDSSPHHPFYEIRFERMFLLAYALPWVTVLETFLSFQFTINHSFSSKCIVFFSYYTMLYMRIKWVNTFKELWTELDLRWVNVQEVLAIIITISIIKFMGYILVSFTRLYVPYNWGLLPGHFSTLQSRSVSQWMPGELNWIYFQDHSEDRTSEMLESPYFCATTMGELLFHSQILIIHV